MNAHGFVSMRSLPGRTYFETSVGSEVVSKFWQIGHCTSMKITICTGANGEPRKSPFCGIPLYIEATSAAPGSPLAIEPTDGIDLSIFEPPLDSTTPSTIPTT